MAIQSSYGLKGFNKEDAYIRIINFKGGKNVLSIEYAVYANEKERINENIAEKMILNVEIDPSSLIIDNTIYEVLYQKLKSLEFPNAIDI